MCLCVWEAVKVLSLSLPVPGLEQEGLYRLPGVKSLVQNLKDAYDRGRCAIHDSKPMF